MRSNLKFSTVLATLAFSSATLAWEITFYSDTPCNKATGSNYEYWNYVGTGQSPCLDIGARAPSDIECYHYKDRGASPPVRCAFDTSVRAASFQIRSGDCEISSDATGCYAGFGSHQLGCQTIAAESFSCIDR
ncbi:hypothetical protein V495_04729 [Pseudogymnoascus sp. VKM F-4514 (FW-929)]|nr:hypothetical protein V495_04729 [Pseudogymnoascus sp. VKM F-4514 (FW-929)]KFY61636.1 hypothetical protein V497_02827 [Pseudogymnoascus sp. VKM F-4516 (FW-969)]